MKTSRKQLLKRLGCAILAFVMVLGTVLTIPFVFELPIFAAADETFDSGAVLIDSHYNGKNILIRGKDVFSVTVVGATGVNIIFEDVTMDRRYGTDEKKGSTIPGLYDVSVALGWQSSANSQYYISTSPLFITKNSSVTVAFRGENNFYAGTNNCTVNNSNVYTAKVDGGGMAGVQVDAGSSLTIAPSSGVLNAYGGYYVDDDNSNNVPNTTLYKEDGNGYGYPAGSWQNHTGGGAGIGGGATDLVEQASSKDYTAGTPGTITINGGIINAYGGHQAAGIGGGVNGAATSTKITINGGTVTAKGGRWAAGIGDGDSLQENYTTCFTNSYTIEINGGTVEAIGGVACPGIGTTDNISGGEGLGGRLSNSGLLIHLYGGSVRARSGYPDGFNPTTGVNTKNKTSAAAAVGAGNDTKMVAQTIYIKSGIEIIASGFGNYAINEDGTRGADSETTPNITAEQARLYNGRFPDLTSKDNRVFTLYEEMRELITVTHNGKKYEDECIKFISQPTNGTAGDIYYYDSDEMVLLDKDKNVIAWGHEDQQRILDCFSKNHLTIYAEEGKSTVIKTVTAPSYFRSIALTLPDPAEHGGLYALRIPTSQVTSDVTLPPDHIDVTISAANDQNIWGKITYPCQYNTKLDAVSSSFLKVDAYNQATNDQSNGMIGEAFQRSVFAYTVYLDRNVSSVWIYALFLKEENVTYKVSLTNASQTDPYLYFITGNDGFSYGYISEEVAMQGDRMDVLIRKTDSGGEANLTAHPIIYKITFIRKAEYTIQLPKLDKIYDGRTVSPNVTASMVVDQYGEAVETVTQEDLDKIRFSYQRINGTISTEDCSAPKNAGTYQVTAVIEAESYTATSAVTPFTISKKTLTVSRIENYLTYVTRSELEEWKNEGTTHPLDVAKLGLIVLDGVVNGDIVDVSVTKAEYNDLSIGYSSNKITLTGVTLTGDGKDNYTIGSTQTVFGQINYRLDGSIFRKPDGSSSTWDKFYPIDSDSPVNDGNKDYHSPKDEDGKFTSHVEYIYARTQGKGERGAVYAMELEFGNMQFVYTEKVWNPDTMEYEEAEDGSSFWIGFDGKNNHVTVINRSNKAVGCTVTAKIDFLHENHGSGNSGIGVGVYNSNDSTDTTNISGVSQAVPAATAGDHKNYGEVGTKQFFIRLTGVPVLVDGGDYTSVGNLTVKFSTT